MARWAAFAANGRNRMADRLNIVPLIAGGRGAHTGHESITAQRLPQQFAGLGPSETP